MQSMSAGEGRWPASLVNRREYKMLQIVMVFDVVLYMWLWGRYVLQ